MQKKYFIKDLEQALGVRRTTIFYWEAAGKIPKARRTSMGNYRWWSKPELERLRKIAGRQV